MSYRRIEQYQFFCDGPPQQGEAYAHRTNCGVKSPVLQGFDLHDVAWWCEHDHNWRIVMGRETPLFTYCPDHAYLAPADYPMAYRPQRASIYPMWPSESATK